MKVPALRRMGKHETIRESILTLIREQGLVSGDRIQSQNQLAKRFGVTAVTVHKVLTELSGLGILRREKGKGTYVGPLAGAYGAGAAKRRTVCLVLPDEGLERPERNPMYWAYVQRLYGVFTECVGTRGTFAVRAVRLGTAPDPRAEGFGDYEAVFFLSAETHRDFMRALIRDKVAPVVMFGPPQQDLPCVSVEQNRLEGMRAGIRHLAEFGYRRIAFVATREHWGDTALNGWKLGLQDCGLAFDEGLVARVVEGSEDMTEAVRQVCREPRPDAIIVDADPRALGVIEGLRAMGLRVPQDIGVMGYDGLDNATRQPPYLTSVSVPYGKMIAAALEEIRRCRAEGRWPEQKHVEFIGEVLPGRTCARRA